MCKNRFFVLLKHMFKEELNLFNTYLTVNLFYLIPFMILIVSSLIVSLATLFESFSNLFIVYLTHFIFLFLGINVGAFGMYAEEILQRRFGNSTTITYSSKILPLSPRKIFTAFVFKEYIFYLLLFVFPILFGIVIASYFLNTPIYITYLFSLILIFLLGSSLVFFMSSLFSRSKFLFLISVFFTLFLLVLFRRNLVYALNPSNETIFINFFLILIFSIVAIFSVNLEVFHPKKFYRNIYHKFATMMPSKYGFLFAKDLLDLSRSVAGFSKIVFSYLIPVALIYVFSLLFVSKFPFINFIFVFSIFFSIFASSIYQWFTQFESYSTFFILPIKKQTILKSKLILTDFINFFSFLLLIFLAIYTKQNYLVLIYSLLLFVSIYYYSLGVLIYLTGFYPHVRLFNVKILIKYFLLIIPVAVSLLLISIFNVHYVLLCFSLFFIAQYFYKKGFEKVEEETVLIF